MVTSLPINASAEDNAEVLRRYNPDNKPWPGISDDGYLYDHLAEHLVGSERQEQLRALFIDDRWLRVRVAQAGYEGYLRDLDVAWNTAYQQATNQVDQGDTTTALLDCALYALIQSTINSIMGNYVPALVKRALETGLWTTSQIKRIAERTTDPERRAAVYQMLGADDEYNNDPAIVETEPNQELFDAQHPARAAGETDPTPSADLYHSAYGVGPAPRVVRGADSAGLAADDPNGLRGIIKMSFSIQPFRACVYTSIIWDIRGRSAAGTLLPLISDELAKRVE